MTAKPECNCLVRHAVSEEERKKVVEGLEYARKVGDNVGITIAMMQLGQCKSTNR